MTHHLLWIGIGIALYAVIIVLALALSKYADRIDSIMGRK